uniref:Uncharacterized protein n=1 Tax=Nymphaea colorata TaxID=210225 RepID=A0A5K1EHU0_9MAGN
MTQATTTAEAMVGSDRVSSSDGGQLPSMMVVVQLGWMMNNRRWTTVSNTAEVTQHSRGVRQLQGARAT